jgi:hypothetical protein
MLDSVLKLTKAAAFWMLGGIVLCLALDRAVSTVTALPITLFFVFAAGIAVFLLVSAVYTFGGFVYWRMHPSL